MVVNLKMVLYQFQVKNYHVYYFMVQIQVHQHLLIMQWLKFKDFLL